MSIYELTYTNAGSKLLLICFMLALHREFLKRNAAFRFHLGQVSGGWVYMASSVAIHVDGF